MLDNLRFRSYDCLIGSVAYGLRPLPYKRMNHVQVMTFPLTTLKVVLESLELLGVLRILTHPELVELVYTTDS